MAEGRSKGPCSEHSHHRLLQALPSHLVLVVKQAMGEAALAAAVVICVIAPHPVGPVAGTRRDYGQAHPAPAAVPRTGAGAPQADSRDDLGELEAVILLRNVRWPL